MFDSTTASTAATVTTVATIVLMAATTYLTRILGYLVLRDRTLSPRMRAVMENVPGCVLISVIAPAFVSRHPADLLALAITLLAATRFSLLPTVIIGVASTGILRHLIG
ncbi:AzlD family protein [Paraburkholderia tagetis]|uniref:AzlD family protein n=1 Tax=Paraburkholderia tagetis TaxID=2913261 RepID=A0A9X1RSP5_9BURK|nr:AzlD family protein [Paraburkholderia tagetis]MCG5075182.1 AzlD family protein [Paraburkholderia tagetis]